MTLKGPSSAAVELRPSAGRLYSVPMNGQEDHKTRELALSKSYRAITLETSDSKRVHALHLAGNAKRPHVLFAKEFEYTLSSPTFRAKLREVKGERVPSSLRPEASICERSSMPFVSKISPARLLCFRGNLRAHVLRGSILV